MVSTPALLLGAGIAGVGVLLLRRRAAAQEQPSSDKCELARALAEKAQPGSGAAAYVACKALGKVIDTIKPTDWTELDKQNRELNGDIEIPLTLALGARTFTTLAGNVPTMRGSAVRFVNGCVPFEGAPGWDKCRPGTHDMRIQNGKNVQTRKLGDPSSSSPARWERAFSRLEGDPFTQGPYTRDSKMLIKGPGGVTLKVAEPKFPLELGAGEVGWYAGGRPFKCAEGKTPAFNLHDHREGADGIPPCDAVTATAGTVAAPLGSSGTTRTELACEGTQAPAGFTWVESPGVPGHWERLRAGQTPNPGPCAGGASSSSSSGAIHTGLLAITRFGTTRIQ